MSSKYKFSSSLYIEHEELASVEQYKHENYYLIVFQSPNSTHFVLIEENTRSGGCSDCNICEKTYPKHTIIEEYKTNTLSIYEAYKELNSKFLHVLGISLDFFDRMDQIINTVLNFSESETRIFIDLLQENNLAYSYE